MFKDNFIIVVEYDKLHNIFNSKVIFDKTDHLQYFPSQWSLEIGDIYYIVYILQHLKPIRHLEFGTSIGTSTLAVLENTNATVWTINCLLNNEKNDYFFQKSATLENWLKSFGLISIDNINGNSPAIIGYKYLLRNLGHRVNQIYANSLNWEPKDIYPPNFFDSVFIDGGHLKEVVINDTLKGLSVLRKNGIIMWHDFNLFNLEQEPFKDVFEGISEIREVLYENFDNLFWIYPSFLLFGIKK